jgi:uroporphyrinogen-III synthase
MRVVVTRPQRDAQGWAQGLQAAGFEPLLLPLIDIEPVPNIAAMQAAWARLHEYQAVMFVSSNAATQFYASKVPETPVQQAQAATKIRAWVTGPGSRRALLQCGFDAKRIDSPALDADQFDSEALWAVVGPQVKVGDKVLIVRGARGDDPETDATAAGNGATGTTATASGTGRNWLAAQLEAAGASVDFLVAYQRQRPVLSAAQQDLVRLAAQDGSVWLLSSSEALDNLAACMPGQTWGTARAVATHVRIAAAARRLGFGVVCESRPSVPSVVASIESMG